MAGLLRGVAGLLRGVAGLLCRGSFISAASVLL